MPPFLNSTNRVLALLIAWSLLTATICWLLSITIGDSYADSLILFTPLYFLFLVFILPNYYVCRGLPIGQTPWSLLISSQALTLVVVVGLWVLAGQTYAGVLDAAMNEPASNTQNFNGQTFIELFAAGRPINIAIVFIQFEILVLVHYLLFAIDKSRDLEQAALQQKLLISQAELQTLKASVHPHFLFNSLNTLANMALSAPDKAHRFCLLIAEFLRYSVAYSKKPTVTLGDELEHVQNYLGIERERFGERLHIDFDIDEGLREIEVPPLILFPLMENAIKHGIDSRIEGGTLTVIVRQNEDMMVVEVKNPVDELGRKLKGTGHGLLSVERRLRNCYGGKALLKTHRSAGGFAAQIYIPLKHEFNGKESR